MVPGEVEQDGLAGLFRILKNAVYPDAFLAHRTGLIGIDALAMGHAVPESAFISVLVTVLEHALAIGLAIGHTSPVFPLTAVSDIVVPDETFKGPVAAQRIRQGGLSGTALVILHLIFLYQAAFLPALALVSAIAEMSGYPAVPRLEVLHIPVVAAVGTAIREKDLALQLGVVVGAAVIVGAHMSAFQHNTVARRQLDFQCDATVLLLVNVVRGYLHLLNFLPLMPLHRIGSAVKDQFIAMLFVAKERHPAVRLPGLLHLENAQQIQHIQRLGSHNPGILNKGTVGKGILSPGAVAGTVDMGKIQMEKPFEEISVVILHRTVPHGASQLFKDGIPILIVTVVLHGYTDYKLRVTRASALNCSRNASSDGNFRSSRILRTKCSRSGRP